MALILTIPPTTLPIGTLGPFVTATLPTNVARYLVTTTTITWPASGDVLSLIVEESPDNGATWRFSAGNSLSAVAGGIGLNKQGIPLTADVWSFTPLFRGDTVQIRLTLQVTQGCRVSAIVESV